LNLRATVLAEYSKAQTDKIVKWVGTSQVRFDELITLFLSDEYRLIQRASGHLTHIVEAQPQLVKKHLSKIVNNLYRPGLPDAVKRNTVRLLQFIPIPKALQGKVMDCCFRFIETPGEAVAVKAFSITILGNLAQQYPDIIPELKTLLEDQLPHQKPAFVHRAKQVIKNFTNGK
jgi:hypothetical protein